MRSLLFIFLLLPSLFFDHSSCAQGKRSLAAGEDSLKSISSAIRKADKDSLRILLNERFRALLRETLAVPGSFDYPFDSLKTIAKISSPDRKFRIYNWNLPAANGTNRYYCIIQVMSKKSSRLIELSDVSDTLMDIEHSILKSGNWYGALYYRILVNKAGSRTFYTLLGWQGCSELFYQKLIDVLSFDGEGRPVFGAVIFRGFRDGRNARVLFRYSSASTMVLKYSQQEVPVGQRKWNPARKAYEQKRKSMKMIVFDQLGPLMERQEGQPVYNVPVGENFDGFLFENGTWNFMQNIKANN